MEERVEITFNFLNYEFRSVTNYGNTDQLMRFKKHFKDEIEQDKLGSPPTKVINCIIVSLIGRFLP